MVKEATYFAYRYFLIPNKQKPLFSESTSSSRERKEKLREIFKGLETGNREHEIGEREYILYLSAKFSDDLYLCKFAIEKSITRHKPENEDIEDIKEPDYPFIYFFVDLNHQLFLIEKNTTVMQKVEYTAKKIEKFMKKEVEKYDFSFKLEEITFEKRFWDFVEKSDGIFELGLRLNSPNLFGGKLGTEELLEDIHDSLNNTESEFGFINEEGNLSVKEEDLEDFIKYITQGGGQWKLDAELEGNRKKVTSKASDNIKSFTLPRELEEQLSEGLKKQVKKEIEKIDDIIEEDGSHKK